MSNPFPPLPTQISNASELQGPIGQLLLEDIKSCSTKQQLDEAMKATIQANAARQIDEDEHNYLVNCIEARRSRRAARPFIGVRYGGRSRSIFPVRRRQRSPDRQKSRERRRTLGGSSALPPSLRAQYTEGHRAVLCVVAQEIKSRGICDFAIDKIAALAGVCRTTVYYALKEASNLGHLLVMERRRSSAKNLTNIVRIISTEWRAWISRDLDSRGAIAFKKSETVSPTGNKESLEERLRRNYAQVAHATERGSSPNSRNLISAGSLNWRSLVPLSVGIGCLT
jgi:hypothetical protein